MKKSLSKPENWQDFESLCKKLWGEIWRIPHKIKKNGRSGQPQCGVDVYGIPKNEQAYWGIQCKGKDEYTNAKLSKKEIDSEIEKALNFKPKLGTFIIATSSNKDVNIEEYIRIKNIESANEDNFEILLYCWEDIVDLIEENRETYNFYVNNQQFKSEYDLEIFFENSSIEYTITPTFDRRIKRYKLKSNISAGLPKIDFSNDLERVVNKFRSFGNINYPTYTEKKNESCCKINITITNTGSVVIEDWRVELLIDEDYLKLSDQDLSSPLDRLNSLLSSLSPLLFIKNNRLIYSIHSPLIQKDSRSFEFFIIPLSKKYSIPIRWKLLARDFSKEGVIILNVNPIYNDNIQYIEVENTKDILDDEILSIKESKNYNNEY